MIKAIRCDRQSFKNVEFHPGLNVVLAERTKESTSKDSRNGLGKTTLLEIMHFCLGAKYPAQGGVLGNKDLLDWTFLMDLDFSGRAFTIRRNTEKPNRVFIDGDWSYWPIHPRVDAQTGDTFLVLNEWNKVLGYLLFGLSVDEDNKYTPTFRSLVSYFIRRGRDAFSSPFEHHRKQLEWDIQVNNAFLLGLQWEHAQKWQVLKDQDKILTELKRAAGAGLMPKLLGKIGELETAKVRLEQQAERGAEQLKTFKVHPQYDDIQQQANALTLQIHDYVNDNVSDERLIEFYRASFESEQPAATEDIAEIYRQAGLIFPEQVIRRLQDVEDFHQRIVVNRKTFLQNEISRLGRLVEERKENIHAASDERATLLVILQTHGALDEYNRLQQLHLQTVAQLEDVKSRIDNLKKFEQGKSAVRIEKETLQITARAEYEMRYKTRESAISFFNANSESLYNVPGKLIIDIDQYGFVFNVEIERSASQGIEQMKVFCYDLMLAQLWANKDPRPDFLVHDSTIFDGVDERQTALAIELAAKESKERNFQYICCLNSDIVPRNDFNPDFKFDDYVRVRLTDATEDGGLLGIRF
jgi:uncharacterized protein YydD (DUF2326 family)